MNAWLSNEVFDDPQSGSQVYTVYRLHKIDEFKPWAAVFWEGAETSSTTAGHDPTNKPNDKPTLSLNRHATVRMLNNTVVGGGMACFAFLDTHCEQWDADAFRTALGTPGWPKGTSPLWAGPMELYDRNDADGGWDNPKYSTSVDITPFVQLN
jgi:hypothetical protein